MTTAGEEDDAYPEDRYRAPQPNKRDAFEIGGAKLGHNCPISTLASSSPCLVSFSQCLHSTSDSNLTMALRYIARAV